MVEAGLGSITTADGVVLSARHRRVDDPRATVVLVHGFSASSDDGAVIRQADALVGRGFDVVSYDGRGHGASSGLCTLGDREALDVAAAVATARAARTGPVIVIGASMGAIAVLRYAATATDPPAGVVAVSSPAAWRVPRTAQGLLLAGMTQTRLGRRIASRRLGVRLSPDWSDPEPPLTLVTRIRCPVAIVHGDRDRFIPARDALALHRACHPPRRLDLVPGMGHAYHVLATAPVLAAAEWALACSPAALLPG